MSYYVRMMRREDVGQVTEIDRQVFPGLLPPVNYRRELENRLAHYLVVCDKSRTVEVAEVPPVRETGFFELTAKVRRLFDHDRLFGNEKLTSGKEYVAGFAGLWILADEAHLINIAVGVECRRLGIGELLLISAIDLATELNANIVTLEVRASNLIAQSLYRKFGFVHAGLRRAYYTDDREDGVLMTAEKIDSVSFQVRLQQLKQEHSRKWGIALYEVVR